MQRLMQNKRNNTRPRLCGCEVTHSYHFGRDPKAFCNVLVLDSQSLAKYDELQSTLAIEWSSVLTSICDKKENKSSMNKLACFIYVASWNKCTLIKCLFAYYFAYTFQFSNTSFLSVSKLFEIVISHQQRSNHLYKYNFVENYGDLI